MEWNGKRYHAAKEPGLKLVLDAGFSCPGRCTFCDNAAFHPSYSTPSKSITQQLEEGIAFHAARGRTGGPYLAYFQSFSNTFASLGRLREVYAEALAHPAVSGLVIGTRPDCVDAEKLDYIASLGCARMEYGIESCRDETLRRVQRGHGFACAEQAVRETAARGIPVCGHFILGLPGETRETLLEDVSRINALPLDSVKFHQLQLLKGTPMAGEFTARPEEFVRWTLEGYIDLLVDILERLRPGIAVGRLAASVPPRFLAVPGWGVKAAEFSRLLDARMVERDTWQGKEA
ncbi:MAG: TIGR01212 family radical SAM protein [Bacteroidales bacterium]|nr:TIGR01212 family radical SAM protein [Bacteroidales bacterium]MBR6864700.1 TIGR01212 family radical SAM protein [Bacteroidales bacterium]